jgi:ribose transport system ATP-binding protein
MGVKVIMTEMILRMKGINKSFTGVKVLEDVDLEIRKGEIHALLGENGAGKTTLMNILGGVIGRDSGVIYLNGQAVEIQSPAEAYRHGIAFIHQELNVINDLPVYENMFLGNEITGRLGKLNAKEMIRETQKVFDHMDVKLDPRAMVRDLDFSYKQIIEIAKAIRADAQLIIMDEPTTSLREVEIEHVFSLMRTLKSRGTTFIFISHKLNEVVEICDRFTVLRNGKKIIDDDIRKPNGKTVTAEEIARYMVGKDVLGVEIYEPREIGDVILEVENLTVEHHVKGVSFKLHRGEVLGFTGLLGDGKSELIRAIFGDIRPSGGVIRKGGKPLKVKIPARARKNKIGLIPSNRKENGIVADLSTKENLTLVALDKCIRGCTINYKTEREVCESYVEKLQISVADIDNLITSLSGGNQQKVVIAKWIHDDPDIIMFLNPTQGVDVGAKNEIYKLIMEMAKRGIGVIVASDESQEILKICDRAIVMYHGEVRGELPREACTEESLMILSTGGSLN